MNTKHKLYFPLFLTLIYFICTINISYSYIKNISTYNPVKNISDTNTTPPASLTSNFLSTTATGNNTAELSKLYSKYAAVIDGDNNRLLFGKETDTAVPMASTTKIMTCVIALEYCNSDFICTTSKYAASMPDVQLNATRGEMFIINDLLYSLMLKSHNDSAVIIAENTAYNYICNVLSGNIDDDYNIIETNIDSLDFLNGHMDGNSSFLSSLEIEQSKMLVHIFTSLMNKKAAALGCTLTHFVTPNGLDGSDDDGIHSTTAYELALIMSYCIKNSDFLKITQTKEYTFSSVVKNNPADTSYNTPANISKGITYSVSNANAFLNMYDNIISGKTGFTGDAGYCYVCAYQCDGRTFIVTLLACGWPNNKTYKWHDAKLLLNWARQNYYYKELINSDTPMRDIAVKNGLASSVKTKIDDSVGLLLGPDDIINITYNVPGVYPAPVHVNDVVGNVNIYINDSLYTSVPVYADDEVMKKDYWYYLKQLFYKFRLRFHLF